MNLDLIKQKLASLEQESPKGGNSKDIWKPEPGKTTVRLLPYKYNPEYPFIELAFYYNLIRDGETKPKTMLSLSSFGDADPIVEFCELAKQQNTGKEKEEWKKANAFIRSLEPVARTYVPVLIRGKESEGVKFWGFGKNIYAELLSLLSDPDWGDISDLKTGRDIVVEYKPAEKEGEYAKTTFVPKPTQTPATTDVEVVNHIKNMVDISSTFYKPTYDELKRCLEKFLNIPEGAAQESKPTPKGQLPPTSNPPKSASAKDDFLAEMNEPVVAETTDQSAIFDMFDKAFED